MRPFLACLTVALVYAVCGPSYDWNPGESSEYEEDSAVLPFTAAPRGYGIAFPSNISMYYTGNVNLNAYNTIEISNDRFDNGRVLIIAVASQAITVEKAKNFGLKVKPPTMGVRRLLENIVSRHPDELLKVSQPRAITLDTSHPSLSPDFKNMKAVPGNFKVRIGNLQSCNYYSDTFIPFGEFGFSTLRPPEFIKLVNITPPTHSAPGWPSRITVRYNVPVALHDVRQIRYEVTTDRHPEQTLVFRFDRVVQREYFPPAGLRRLLHAKGPVPATPNTPCLPFCEADPSSPACQACCTTVVHEKPWSCGDDSEARCCKTWDADCWDTPSDKNIDHSCNMCAPSLRWFVNTFTPEDWLYVEDNNLIIDNQALVYYGVDFPELRRALLYSAANVKLVVERGALVDAYSQSVPNAPVSWSFRVNRKPKQVTFELNGRSTNKLPPWLNFTMSGRVKWRCPTEVRGFGLRHKDLAGGDVMRPGDACRFPVAIDSPPPTVGSPYTNSPSMFPTNSPTLMPTPQPTAPTSSPTFPASASPTVSVAPTSQRPSTGSPSQKPTTLSPTQRPTESPTIAPTTSPTTDPLAPRTLPCEQDQYWPVECPYPEYIKLVVTNESTTLAVDTTTESFRQDFKDLDKISGQVTVTMDPFALVSDDGLDTPVVTDTDEAMFVIDSLNSDGLALTPGGLRIPIGQNLVIIPPGTVTGNAVVETGIVTPPPPNVPIPVSDVIRIVVRKDNKTLKIENLAEPIQMFLPIPAIIPIVAAKWSPCQKQVYYHDATCVWFDEATSDWSTAGCSTNRENATQTQCRCNHLTDFAVLQALESCQEVDPMPYYVFAGPFFCIFLYCLWASGTLLWHRDAKKAGWGSLFGQHLLMAVASIARALGPLAIMPGVSIAATSTLFALPYLAKFPSFLLLVVQWATIVHFAMQTGGGRRYMMPAFAVFCVLIELTVVGLFVNFHATESVESVLAGTATLAVLAALFSIAFLAYAYFLARSFPKELSSPQAGSGSGAAKARGLRFRVQVGGFCFALFFIIEAICHPIALYLQQQNVEYGLTGITSAFLLAEFLSYVLILWLFYPALKSRIKAASRESNAAAELVRASTQSKLSSQKSASRL